jgi:hypothetical protein
MSMKEDLAVLLTMLLSDTFKGFHIHPKILILKILSRKSALRLNCLTENLSTNRFHNSFTSFVEKKYVLITNPREIN